MSLLHFIKEIVCDDFSCKNTECIHHKNILRKYPNNFLFKTCNPNNLYDCGDDAFVHATTWYFENYDLKTIDKEYFESKGIQNAVPYILAEEEKQDNDN